MLKSPGRNKSVHHPILSLPSFRTDCVLIRPNRKLLKECILPTILGHFGGTIQGAEVNTGVLFFEKGAPKRRISHYQLDPGRNLG